MPLLLAGWLREITHRLWSRIAVLHKWKSLLLKGQDLFGSRRTDVCSFFVVQVKTEEHAWQELLGNNLRSFRPLAFAAIGALMIYLCWRIIAPFITALSWAFALALIVRPAYGWLLRRGVPRTFAAVAFVSLTVVAVIGPATVLTRALAKEATEVAGRVSSDAGIRYVREGIEKSRLTGPLFQWLDARYDLPNEAMQLARSVAGWASRTASSALAGSMWFLTQLAVALFVLFYFLRDGEVIAQKLRLLLPLPAPELDTFFERITQTIRVSLAGKVVVATIQGTLGGLIFAWLGLPAPVFWGSVMAALSLFPVVGAFVIWLPAALILALAGDWKHALLLVGWGVLVIHPIDNLLGPILVGSTLHLHTLLMFFSIIGGLAAFGPSGIVLGPVIIAVAVALVELAERSLIELPSKGN
jgi:predicted PurR-regulated permease PerM